jgi:cyanophycinase
MPGAVVVIGGALRADGGVVWQRIVDEAGGPGAPLAVLPTASLEPARAGAQLAELLNRHGARAEVVPVAPHLDGVCLQEAVNDPALVARVAACRGVVFSGGAQQHIVDSLQPRGEATPMLGAIRAVAAAGGVIAGTSAGAAVLSRLMFRDAMDSLAVLKGQWRAGREYDRGLGFLDPALLVDQHFLKRGRLGRLLPALQALGCRFGLGVDENAAVVVRGGLLEVIGGSGAVLVDGAGATRDAHAPAFNLRDARLWLLEPGDRHDLASGETWPAASRLEHGRVAPAASAASPAPRYFMDILGDGCLRSALDDLLDGAADEVRGLACRLPPESADPDDPDDPAPDLGFEFRLRRGPRFAGWRDEGGCTVVDVRVDVVPVRVANPLFTPLRMPPDGVVESLLPTPKKETP